MFSCSIRPVGIILFLFISACTKDEFTLPVRVRLNIAFYSGKPQHMESYMVFSYGQIGIQEIEFEGIREAGGDVFFNMDPDLNLPTIEFGTQPSNISLFNIPQGIYNFMKWDFSLKKIIPDELIGDDYTDTQNTGLILKGYYHSFLDWGDWPYWNVIEDTIPVILIVNENEIFDIRACDVNNNSMIVLHENKEYEATILFDLDEAFRSVTFDEAERSGDSEHPIIILPRYKNEQLYNMILYRLNKYARVRIK